MRRFAAICDSIRLPITRSHRPKLRRFRPFSAVLPKFQQWSWRELEGGNGVAWFYAGLRLIHLDIFIWMGKHLARLHGEWVLKHLYNGGLCG